MIKKFVYRAAGAGGEGGQNENPEILAIKKIGEQVESFKTLLGEKADAEQFKSLEDKLKSLEDGIESMKAAEISKAIEAINKSNEAIHKQIVELQEEAAKAKEVETKSNKNVRELVSTKAVEDFIKATFENGEKTHKAARIEIKAAETFGTAVTFVSGSDATAYTGRFIDPTLYQRKRKRNLILDNLQIRTINVPTLLYLEKVEVGNASAPSGDPGAANWILAGSAKPKRSFRLTTGKVEAKKVAIFGTIEDKLLRDVASMENWIREDFIDEMNEKINDGLLNNNPSVNALAPLGLKTNAVTFTPTTAFDETIPLANYIDAIIAVIAFMADNKEQPGSVHVSDDVFYAIHNLKATDGKYLNNNLVYVNQVGQLFIAGVQVMPADSEDIPSTHILALGADLGFKAYAYGPMVFERGLNGEDFREDKTSYRAYQEFLSFIPENRENSVVYDTFANILLAITQPVTP